MNTHAALSNRDLREEIKAYWSQRAETFDTQPGHEIFSERERAAWYALLRRHLGEGTGRAALDLACGTAVISHLLDDLGFKVTGSGLGGADAGARPGQGHDARPADPVLSGRVPRTRWSRTKAMT